MNVYPSDSYLLLKKRVKEGEDTYQVRLAAELRNKIEIEHNGKRTEFF